MIAIVCVDDSMGMLFNNRRQSQDKILTEKIAKLAEGKKLWMNSFSYGLFENSKNADAVSDGNFLFKAAEGEYCFAENCPLKPVEDRIEKLIVFKWNRAYPSDVKLDISLTDGFWKLSEASDFAGSSHSKITMEVYVK